VREGDNIEEVVVSSLLKAAANDGFTIRDRDVVGLTESIVARAQGNYATVDAIASDLRAKFSDAAPLGVVFPILSRNRFAVLLKAIARSVQHVVIQFSYPSDEVGNQLLTADQLEKCGVNPWSDDLSEERFKELFGNPLHPFTGVDYISYYRFLVEAEGAKCTMIFSNRPQAVVKKTSQVLVCDVHTRHKTKERLLAAGAEHVLSLDQVLVSSVDGSGFHPQYGLLGSNKSGEEGVKLFPRDCQPVVEGIQRRLLEATGCKVEVMVYGDGAFKDPVGQIWELADPVVSPAYTRGLEGTPNEIKLKYLADNQFSGLNGEELRKAIVASIRDKKQDLNGSMESQGTTPRRITDLIGSLCDLTSGSGDKGTPVVHIQGYFDNLASV
jgi:F420-0:gamma-glutamyl ligase